MPLLEALLEYDAEPLRIIKNMIKNDVNKTEINKKNLRGQTPLLLASRDNYPEIIKPLLKHGSNIHDRDEEGKTPLILASTYGNLEIVKILLQYGSNIHDRDECGYTAFLLASHYGHTKTVKLLLEHGANTQDVNNYGCSNSLQYASYQKQLKIIKLLLKYGVNTNDKNENEGLQTPLMTVIGEYVGADDDDKKEKMEKEEIDIEIIKLYLEHGSNIYDKNYIGETPLTFATIRNNPKILELLLNHNTYIQTQLYKKISKHLKITPSQNHQIESISLSILHEKLMKQEIYEIPNTNTNTNTIIVEWDSEDTIDAKYPILQYHIQYKLLSEMINNPNKSIQR